MNGFPLKLESFRTEVTRLPVAVVQAADLYAVRSCMNEAVVSNVNPHVRRAGFICCEEDEVTNRRAGNAFHRTPVSRSACSAHTCLFIQYIPNESAAVKAGSCRSAPFIWRSD